MSEQRKLPRIVWEILAFVVLAAIGYGFWTWSDYRWQQRLTASEQQWETELAAEKQSTAEVLAERRAKEGEVVARAFTAGIRGAVTTGRMEAVDAAVGELLRLPGVVFVHVLERDGGVIATSDRKLVTTGQAGPRAEWALAARDVASRAGAEPETSEVAVPVTEGDGAVLWLGYDFARSMAPPPAEPASEEPASEEPAEPASEEPASSESESV